MSEKLSPKDHYTQRKEHFTKILTRQKRINSVLSNLRFCVFFMGIGGFIYLLYRKEFRASGICFMLALFLFLFLVMRHERMKRKVQQTNYLIQLNELALERLAGEWTKFTDLGKEFIDFDHPYSSDLDIFGKASAFQWLNSTATYLGRNMLKDLLTNPTKDADEISHRQEAVRELASKLDWRQRFQVEGKMNAGGELNPARLLEWLEKPEERLVKKWQIIFIYALPSITIIWLIWALFLTPTPSATAVIPLLVQSLIIFLRKKKMTEIFSNFIKYKHCVKVYENLLHAIGSESFTSEYMQEVKLALFDEQGQMASEQIKKLGKIIDLLDIRFVPLYHVLCNAMFLWDYHCLLALERWKAHSGQVFRGWLEALAKAEALSSVAIIHFDHPTWAFPQLSAKEESEYFSARGMGHPLLPETSRVCNDLTLPEKGTILLITGSNMSGKSTLLRTVGVNLVLAYAGAPVCAEEMQCSLMQLYSSMRVNDNLEKSISSFYAELLRVKMIIDASRKQEPMLFLLDELFRGTNSRDRHIGAKAVLRNLSRAGTMGLVSTHDLELADLEQEHGLQVKNFHFTEGYKGDQIYFDYKLQPGVSTTSNAIYLMKMIGIDTGEE